MSLFLDHAVARDTAEALENIRVLIRRAKRYTTKCESRGGMDANSALHEAEVEVDRALRALRR